MMRKLVASVAACAVASALVSAQALQASPEGKAQVQVAYTGTGFETVKTGKWIEITYGRPILRGRTNIFGSGATYGARVLVDGAKIWRAGANVSTRLRTEAALAIGGKVVPAGEYTVFIDLKDGAWTFVLSRWAAQLDYDPKNKAALWGSFDYTPDKDVVRVPMKLAKNTMSIEELTWTFANVSVGGGDLVIMWDKEIASVPFKVAS